ncbi:hypothetical protein [Aquitalea sp. LB_tupeE]|uniref:hypothetical protein n=1 Tax=Aquitalea sp. LB_tupeE TaxID=2748078 RepID=UPI0015C17198|nr:hypothetical protein [Aquitalea sp. LB_tupeE]NWK79550.1 hypothetical protein [Aquitalea sp. LB_tupeE]
MARKYQYLLQISLEGSASDNLFKNDIQYAGGGSRLDHITIDENLITLKCERVSLIDLDGVFINYQSAIYSQVAKGISFYICSKQAIPKIERISLAAKRGDNIVSEKIITKAELKDPGALLSKFTANFDINSLKTIFDESEKSSTILKAISYLIRSKTKVDPFDQFDSLWKAYNAIYRIIGKSKKDHDCQVALRNFLIKNKCASKNTAKKITGISATSLRSLLRWRALILNDYENAAKSQAFCDFILRYKDPRIMEVIREILPYRTKFLTDSNLLETVEDHIDKNIRNNVKCDEEVIALICIKYMYFVRNKSAHGERLDRIIGLKTKESKEIKWLSDLLETLIIDLINANHIYH